VRAQHKQAHAVCEYGATNWSDCDKARTNAYNDWLAMQQVILAYRIVVGGRAAAYRKDKSTFGRLVQYIAGEAEDITTADGDPNESAWVGRLRAAVERVKEGNLPAYNLYPPT
jgi:hypothetical protein